MMRYLFLALALVSLGACQKLEELTEFELDYTTNVTIPSTFGINLPFNINTPNIPTNTESTFAAKNTATNLIDRINLRQVKLTVTAPQGQTLEFIESVNIYISADGLGELAIASKTNVPVGTGGELLLDVAAEADLKPYIQKEAFSMRVSMVQRQALGQNVDIRLDNKFFVKARLI